MSRSLTLPERRPVCLPSPGSPSNCLLRPPAPPDYISQAVSLLVVSLWTALAAAQSTPARSITTRAPPRPASKQRKCKRNADCVFLPTICPGCPPCQPAWLEVGNREEAARIRGIQATVDCKMPTCKVCAHLEYWLGTRTRCVKGQCAAEHVVPFSKELTCKTDADCVFCPNDGCGGPPCGDTWQRACNRKHAAWLSGEFAREQCPRIEHAKCDKPVRMIGSKVACRRAQCIVLP